MPAPLKIQIKPQLLHWACERAGLDPSDLAHRFPAFRDWLTGNANPTLRQLERFAAATHAPIGYLFLQEPPLERVPIPDFRTVGNQRLQRPSGDLLDTVYACQRRQVWYRDFATATGQEPLPFVGAAQLSDDVVTTAAAIRSLLSFDVQARSCLPSWTEALRLFIDQAEAMGVLVMVSGIVANNTHRTLDPEEFRGFALADDRAPLVFLNGADTKAAQMFTLAHELAHVWLGQSGISDVSPASAPARDVEVWCNRVAAELLVPLHDLSEEYRKHADLQSEVARLARHFKVSTLVVLRRIHDAGGLTRAQFSEAYAQELARLRAMPKGSGGDFYRTQTARVGKRFARALVVSTLEGETLYRDAFQMLGIAKLATFQAFGQSLGVA